MPINVYDILENIFDVVKKKFEGRNIYVAPSKGYISLSFEQHSKTKNVQDKLFKLKSISWRALLHWVELMIPFIEW